MASSDPEDQVFQEDDDPDPEFERKLEESYGVQFTQKKESSRPNSSGSNRPQTASRHRSDDHDSPKIAALLKSDNPKPDDTKALLIYAKIADHLTSRHIPKTRLALNVPEIASMEEFRTGMERLGLTLTVDEIATVWRDCGVQRTKTIRSAEVFAKVMAEEKVEEDIPPRREHFAPAADAFALKNETEKVHFTQLLVDSQTKITSKIMQQRLKSAKDRPTSSSVKGGTSRSFRPTTAVSRPSAKSQRISEMDIDSEMRSLQQREQKLTGDTVDEVKTKKFLRQTIQRQREEEKELALTVDKCKKEFEYECLHKMGEANEIAQNEGLQTAFRAIKKEDGSTMCHMYEGEEFVQELTLENFLREWRRLKRLQKPSVNLASKVQAQPEAGKPASLTPGTTKVNKKERQEELKKLLLETKELTNKLKEQLKVLEKKGLISRSLHTSSVAYSTTG